MSNSNNTFNGSKNLVQTSLDDAYKFETFSSFINNNINTNNNTNNNKNNIQPTQRLYFSPQCIFCSSNNSISLINDGSFRQCQSCNKQFKSLLIHKNK
jgi:hypothetical protein